MAFDSLTNRMRDRTSEAHRTAERSGIIAALFSGAASRLDYAIYLRNLLPAYQALEEALSGRADLEPLALPELFRTPGIIGDLGDLAGPDWAAALPLLPSAGHYAARIEAAGAGPRLIAHCYTRYLGDLNGGQMLGRRLKRMFGPKFRALAFTEFPGIGDVDAFRRAYRDCLDQAASGLADAKQVIEEAVIAFDLNIRLSIEIATSR